MKKFTIICCFLSLFIPSIKASIRCKTSIENCKDVRCTEKGHKETTDIQEDILAELYGIPRNTVDEKIKYWYNYYGCSCEFALEEKNRAEDEPGPCVYKGGHAGWDVRTFWDRDPTLKNHEFYCITPGIVLANGGRDENGNLPKCNVKSSKHNRTIVIYDEISGYATHYLHADNVSLSLKIGEFVDFGETLGTQGNCGLSGGEHIHVEVRALEPYCAPGIPYKYLTNEMKNKLVKSSGGTKDTEKPTIDPIPYLYNSVKSNEHIKSCTLPEIWGRCKIMHD